MAVEFTKGQYSIQLASKISGVGVHTIRAWEKRYNAVCPERNDSGRREYSDSDIERLTLLSELCTLGHSIGKIASLPTEELKSLLEKLGKRAENVAAIKAECELAKSPVDIEDSLKSLLMALQVYKLDIISHEISKLKLVLTPRELALEIIGPLLREVGNQVLEGFFSISQEHALSAIVKFHMGHLLFRGSPSKGTNPHKIILCTPEGDYHEFGILQSCLLCSHYKIPYYYLGPNLPAESLLYAYDSLEADTILIGSLVVPENKTSEFVNSYFDKVARGIERGQMIVGGNNHIDRLRLEKNKRAKFIPSLMELDEFLKNY